VWGHGLKLAIAPWIWRMYRQTIALPDFDLADDTMATPLIFACLHRDMIPVIMHVRSLGPAILVSSSADGDILVRTLGETDYRYVRGASGQDGRRAFGRLRQELLSGHCIGVAVDGPAGPFGRVKEGALQLSRLSGVPIIPLRAQPHRKIELNTWDRTVVPLPFSRVTVRQGRPLLVPRSATDSELRRMRRELEQFLSRRGADRGDS